MKFRFRPSKPVAVMVAVLGTAMGIFGWVQFGGENMPFLILWTVFIVAIVGMNLWSAFSAKGSAYTIERTDEP